MPDPFGLKANSTPSIDVAKYLLSFHAVPKPHPSFKNYSGSWTPEHGLVSILAASPLFEDEADCHSARILYEKVKRQLSHVYGEPRVLELIDEDSIWQDEDEFYSSLANGERSHSCVWAQSTNLDAEIVEINLMVCADESYNSSLVYLAYKFAGHDQTEPSDDVGLASL